MNEKYQHNWHISAWVPFALEPVLVEFDGVCTGDLLHSWLINVPYAIVPQLCILLNHLLVLGLWFSIMLDFCPTGNLVESKSPYLFLSVAMCINRASASWRQPSCTSSSWHRSAGCLRRLGSPTWPWQERFGPGLSASAFCVLDGVSSIFPKALPHLKPCLSTSSVDLRTRSKVFLHSSVCLSLYFSSSRSLAVWRWLDLHPVRFSAVMPLCSHQTIWGFSKWTGLGQWGDWPKQFSVTCHLINRV